METARINFDTVRVMSHHGPYGPSNHNETARAILWENLDGSSGQVAMAKSWAGDNNLPETQDFAWDRSKGVYSLRGFHGQHCLVRLLSKDLFEIITYKATEEALPLGCYKLP
jgi:hypothetical protein